MPDTTGGKITAIPTTMIGRVIAGARNYIADINGAWFGPGQPIPPLAPAGTGGRQFDYAYGANLQYNPRSEDSGAISFEQLRALADNFPLLRGAIETRKDQLLNTDWAIKPRDANKKGKKSKKPQAGKVDTPAPEDPRIQQINDFLLFPDRENTFGVWIRQLVEEMLVIDAATIYPRMTRGGDVYSLDLVDGATIKRLINADGRTPEAPDPAYQQILHGVPAADFTRDELVYLPRNKRVHKFYGYSPVEQIVLTVNIALRREVSTLAYYTEGTLPDSFINVPKEWSIDQVKAFQEYFDFLMSGNLAERRKARFIPGDSKVQDVKQPPLKDQYDEWLARIVCWALNVTVSPLVSQVNRATGDTLKIQATEEGKRPTQDWLKSIFNIIIWKFFGYTDLEFVWEDEDTTDVVKLAQSREIYVKNGILGVDDVLEDMGRDGIGVGHIIITAMGAQPLKESVDKALEDIKNPPPPPPQLVMHNGSAPPNPDGNDNGGKSSGAVDGAGDSKNSAPNASGKGEAGKTAVATFRKALDSYTRSKLREAGDAESAPAITKQRRRWSA